MTFRIECFVEDRSLANALRALAELKVSGLDVQPVVNRTKAGTPVHGSKLEAAAVILDKMPTPFTVKSLNKELRAIGIKDSNYYLQRWKRDKLLKLKMRGVWQKLPHKVVA